MKREYSKPTIHVEVMSLDMPIASGCQNYTEAPELSAQGWFVGDNCDFSFDNALDDMGEVGDTLCYHSQANITMSSI